MKRLDYVVSRCRAASMLLALHAIPVRPKSTEQYERLASEQPITAPKKPRKMLVMKSTEKGRYIHFRNYYAQWWWLMSTFRWYYFCIAFAYGLTHVVYRYRMGAKKSAETVMIGENLLDETCKVYLGEIEKLREKDPIRLEKEANDFHEQFWKTRAFVVADTIKKRRERESREEQALVNSKGTDMSEWMEAKTKDKKEKEVARRTKDYIRGFHQHLKVKKLI